MKKLLFISLTITLIQSCNNGTAEQKQDAKQHVSLNASIGNVQVYRPNIELTPWEGDLRDAMYWTDTTGEHAIIISGKSQYFWQDENPTLKSMLKPDQDPDSNSEVAEIFARHYVLPKGTATWKLEFEYSDHIFGCCDVWMEYQKNSLQVMDADSTGSGEVLFMYHTTEADGNIGNLWHGHFVLLKDSATFVSEGYTGYEGGANQIAPRFMPESGPYFPVVAQQFQSLKEGWITSLREEEKALEQHSTTEENHDHDSHNH